MILKKAIIIKILDIDNRTPKHLAYWNEIIEYDTEMVKEGFSVLLYYSNRQRAIRTSEVKDVKRDDHNLTIHTLNSIYYIKNFIK